MNNVYDRWRDACHAVFMIIAAYFVFFNDGGFWAAMAFGWCMLSWINLCEWRKATGDGPKGGE